MSATFETCYFACHIILYLSSQALSPPKPTGQSTWHLRTRMQLKRYAVVSLALDKSSLSIEPWGEGQANKCSPNEAVVFFGVLASSLASMKHFSSHATLWSVWARQVPLGQAKKLLDCLAELQRHKRTAHPRVTWSAGDAASAGSADGMAPLWPTDPNSACQIVLCLGLRRERPR